MPLSKGQLTRQNNPNWKGGRTVASNGYVLVKMPGHPLADCRGYVYEHRLVAQSMIGRPLHEGEEVHHIDRNKQNNSPDNLRVEPSRHHHQVNHRTTHFDLRLPDEPNPEVTCACSCGARFPMFDYQGRPRRYVSGHNLHGRRVRYVG